MRRWGGLGKEILREEIKSLHILQLEEQEPAAQRYTAMGNLSGLSLDSSVSNCGQQRFP